MVTTNDPAEPVAEVADAGDVIAGASSTKSENDWCAAEPTPFDAVIVSWYSPPISVPGVPARVAVPSPLSVKVTPAGRVPVSLSAASGRRLDVIGERARGAGRERRRRARGERRRLVDDERERLGRVGSDPVGCGDRDRVVGSRARRGSARDRRSAVAVVGERHTSRERARLRFRRVRVAGGRDHERAGGPDAERRGARRRDRRLLVDDERERLGCVRTEPVVRR